GGFIYDATIDQRGDFYSSVFESRFVDGYNYNPSVGLGPVGASIVGLPVGTPVSALLAPTANVGLFTAKNNCLVANPSQTCAQNYSVNNSAENLTLDDQTRNDNLVVGLWEGDDGSDSNLNVINGINSVGSDLLYATQTEREATAVYTQGVWNISEKFALTVGLRYAVDEVTAEENLFRYTETFGGNPVTGDNVLARFITDNFATANDLSAALYALNAANGGFALDAAGDVSVDQHGQPIPTQSVVNAGFPIAVSVYRPFQRDDEKLTGRINLDWDVTEEVRLYFSATSGYRSGGYNLVFFSNSAAYDPEELIAYEFGYKTRFFDNTLQINGSVYFYDYDTIHTVATEVTSLGGTSTSVLEAPGAEIKGIEAEILWLATERITLGGNFSFTPSEYTEDLSILDPARVETPTSLFPDEADNTSNINGNQLLQVPESKFTVYGTYSIPMNEGAKLDLSSVYSWTDEVYYSPFENDREKAEAYGRLDIRATWTNAKQSFVVAGYVNNILDDVAVLQVLRHGENENFRQSAGTTLPRAYGLEFTLNFGGN
ncbi:MAG: iron complex outermembrane receptor protein, partial [Candidatus Azotimanducaceae bacterium]